MTSICVKISTQLIHTIKPDSRPPTQPLCLSGADCEDRRGWKSDGIKRQGRRGYASLFNQGRLNQAGVKCEDTQLWIFCIEWLRRQEEERLRRFTQGREFNETSQGEFGRAIIVIERHTEMGQPRRHDDDASLGL
jgi:hypothetical protein